MKDRKNENDTKKNLRNWKWEKPYLIVIAIFDELFVNNL